MSNAANANINSQNHIVFIDSAVADYEKLAAGVERKTEVTILNSTKNGIAQITNKLAQCSNISTVHIVSHGNPGNLQLGNNFLNYENIYNYTAQLREWQKALSENAEIFIYGCNVASDGRNFLQRFAELTNANIAASDDLTGNAALGGDWELKVQIGEIRSPLIFSPAAMAEYQGLLSVENTISITATTANAVENGVNGVFRIQRTNSIDDLTVNLAIDNNSLATIDDYTLAIDNSPISIKDNSFSITIANGESFVDVNLNATAEAISFAEGDETLKINLAPSTEYQISDDNNTATVTINANGFLVTNTEDSTTEYKQGSLRQAILNANNISGENTITFDTNGIFATAQTITLAGEELTISDSLIIQGTGANKLTLSGNNTSRIFTLIDEEITTTFAGLTITQGNGIEDLGGGIFVGESNTLNLINSSVSNNKGFIGGGIGNSGTLNLINSTISGNTAFFGGGIDNTGTLNLINSTISGNTADFRGGGIYSDSGTVTLINVTVANNSANVIGAGIFNEANATFNLANTIVANNKGTNTDLDGNFNDLGNNLIGKSNSNNGLVNGLNGSIVGTSDTPVDPKLRPLANNGGTTLTHALLIDSPVINRGNNSLIPAVLTTDQRNSQRIIGTNIDIGAVEFLGYTISGKTFDDLNNNGKFDPNENGIENWTVYVDDNNNNTLDPGELFTTTDTQGNYSFFVEPGIYNIQALQQVSWKQTNLNPNLINITDADVNNVNLGNFKLGQISGKVFHDLNQNGIFNQDEIGIKDWQIFIDTNENDRLDETEQFTTTDDNGNYIFTNLIAGTYKIRQVQQNQWQQITINPAEINIISGSNVTDVNFGNFHQQLPEIDNDFLAVPTTPTNPSDSPSPTNPTSPVILNVDCFCDEITQPDVNNLPNVSLEINSIDNIQFGDEENNFLLSTNSNNALFGFGGEDLLLGGIGEDNLLGGTGNDLIFGGDGRDWIGGNEGDDIITGNEGNDIINGNQGNDTVFGGQGDDFVRGGQDNDLLLGDVGNDTLAGDRGNDTVFGGGSNASGNSDNDLIFGGSGDDLLHGNTGNDTIFGEDGNDTVHGGQDDDIVCGGVGEDILYGDLGNDSLCGGDGNDTIFGGNGGETSASDNDYICGGIGNDLVFGNQGADWIYGETGNDTLYGGQGDDTLIGGDGNDLLSGGLGNDTLTGGNGSDIFVLAVGKGSDVITDFQDGIDFLLLSDDLTFQQLSIVQSGNNTLISLASNNELLATLNGISASLITQQDFVLLA